MKTRSELEAFFSKATIMKPKNISMFSIWMEPKSGEQLWVVVSHPRRVTHELICDIIDVIMGEELNISGMHKPDSFDERGELKPGETVSYIVTDSNSKGKEEVKFVVTREFETYNVLR
jgi:hypothetical protein